MTSPRERVVRPGFETKVPRTPDEFADRWITSKERQALLDEIDEYQGKHPPDQRHLEFKQSRRTEQQKHMRSSSTYLISYAEQVKLNLWRAYRRLVADPSFTIASLLYNMVLALMLGSMFFDMKADSSTFYYRGGVIFFSLLLNAFASQLEVSGTAHTSRHRICWHNWLTLNLHRSLQYMRSALLSRNTTDTPCTDSQRRRSPAT